MPLWGAIVLGLANAVGIVQGAAWLGSTGSDRAAEQRAHRRGAWLTPACLLILGLTILLAAVPGFFT